MHFWKLKSYLIVSLFGLALMFGCSGANSLAKRGEKMQAAGHYTEAADYYYQGLLRNRNNVRAKLGMLDAGQKVLNDHLDAFNRTNNMGELHNAVQLYLKAQDYSQKIGRAGVNLEIPAHYTRDFEASKVIVLEEMYNEATALLDDDQYEEAQRIFKEISTLDSNYRDANALSSVAYSEPLYIQGKVALDNGAYRMAYDYFGQILSRTKNYKDTRALQQEAVEKGRVTVALVPFENVTNEAHIEKRISAYVLEELSKVPDPFLRFVDRSDMDQILQEQQLSVSGAINDETATVVGELVGAQAILTGKVLAYKQLNGRIQRHQMNGYEGYQVKKKSPETGAEYIVTQYKPVKYNQYTGSSSVVLTFQYKLLSLETGEVMLSQLMEREAKDDINYATYDGNTSMLYPANGDNRNASAAAKRGLDNLLRARRTLKNESELSSALFGNVSTEIAGQISNYMHKP